MCLKIGEGSKIHGNPWFFLPSLISGQPFLVDLGVPNLDTKGHAADIAGLVGTMSICSKASVCGGSGGEFCHTNGEFSRLKGQFGQFVNWLGDFYSITFHKVGSHLI